MRQAYRPRLRRRALLLRKQPAQSRRNLNTPLNKTARLANVPPPRPRLFSQRKIDAQRHICIVLHQRCRTACRARWRSRNFKLSQDAAQSRVAHATQAGQLGSALLLARARHCGLAGFVQIENQLLQTQNSNQQATLKRFHRWYLQRSHRYCPPAIPSLLHTRTHTSSDCIAGTMCHKSMSHERSHRYFN